MAGDLVVAADHRHPHRIGIAPLDVPLVADFAQRHKLQLLALQKEGLLITQDVGGGADRVAHRVGAGRHEGRAGERVEVAGGHLRRRDEVRQGHCPALLEREGLGRGGRGKPTRGWARGGCVGSSIG